MKSLAVVECIWVKVLNPTLKYMRKTARFYTFYSGTKKVIPETTLEKNLFDHIKININ